VFWSASVDVTHSASSSHYGAPLITASNTVIVPTVTSAPIYSIKAYDGATGRLKYTLTNDYRLLGPLPMWLPVYQPVLVSLPSGLRLYYPGAGGTVCYVENPDSDTPSQPVKVCFYTNLTGYAANAAAFNSSLFIDTPLTASTNGALYFGYRAVGTVPAPINSGGDGFVRIGADGTGSYVLCAVAAGASSAWMSQMNCAPALSIDGSTVYMVAGSGVSRYLVGLDSATLATKFARHLAGGIADFVTSSPTIGPDGDVYFAAGPLLFHFSADLATNKLSGFFGYDYTVAVVPSSLIPSYSGSST